MATKSTRPPGSWGPPGRAVGSPDGSRPGALLRRLVGGALCLGALGCVSIDETYHLKATEIDRNGRATTNYYRVKIDGWTCFSASQYAAGLYDKDAVASLFGEFEGQTVSWNGVADDSGDASPAAGNGGSGSGNGGAPGDGSTSDDDAADDDTTSDATSDDSGTGGGTQRIESIGGDPVEGRTLVLFLSTNANALVDQISSFVTESTITSALSGMLVAPKVEELDEAKLKSERSDAERRLLAAKLQNIGERLKALPAANQTVANVQPLLVEAIRELARSTGETGSAGIGDADSALAWLAQHPDAFRPREVR